MTKLAPVSKRKTFIAWVLVLGLAILCIGLALFLQNSKIFGSTEAGSNNLSARFCEENPGMCAQVPVSDLTSSDPCKQADAIVNDILGHTNDNTFQTSVEQVYYDYKRGNISDKVATEQLESAYDVLNKGGWEKNNPYSFRDNVTKLEKAYTGCSNKTTVPTQPCTDKIAALKLDANEKLTGYLKTQTAWYFNTYSDDPANLSKNLTQLGDDNPAQAEYLYTLSQQVKDECNTTTSPAATADPCGQALTTANSKLFPGQADVVSAIKNKDKNKINTLQQSIASAAPGQTQQYKELYTTLSKQLSGCADQIKPSTGTTTTPSNSDIAAWNKFAFIANGLQSLIDGDYKGALGWFAAAVGSEKAAQMMRVANANPALFYDAVMREQMGQSVDWGNLVGSAATGSNGYGSWYNNPSEYQKRAMQMATDLIKINTGKSIFSSIAHLIGSLMPEEQGAKFTSKVDEILGHLGDIATGAIQFKNADLAALANNYYNNGYGYGSGYPNPYSDNTTLPSNYNPYLAGINNPISNPAGQGTYTIVQTGSDTFDILLNYPLTSLIGQANNVLVHMVAPTQQGIAFIYALNQYLQQAQGTAARPTASYSTTSTGTTSSGAGNSGDCPNGDATCPLTASATATTP